ncbi:MAG: T9SS type A sorting domain-containing protein [Paludibacteraceae bacterium]|nr:T9SS type A sorting domain-containing protein [Paludibacteraceae bacterium]
MQKILSIFAALLIAFSASASSVESFVHTPNCGTNEGTNKRTFTTEHFSIVMEKGPSSGDQLSGDDLPDLRVFKNSTLTISASKSIGNIDSVKIYCIFVGKSSQQSFLNATYRDNVGNTMIIPSFVDDTCCLLSPTSVLTNFSIVASANQMRISQIDFYYSDNATLTPMIVADSLVDFGTVVVGSKHTKTIDIKLYNVDETPQIILPTEQTLFSFDFSKLTKDGGPIEITLDAQKTGHFETQFSISVQGVNHEIGIQCVVVSTGEADGSHEHPYSVSDIITLNHALNSTQAWVEGYIWGKPKNTGEIDDKVSDDGIALGQTPEYNPETDRYNFVPVQIPNTNNLREELGIMSNPQNIGRRVLVYGTLDKYYDMPGLKNTSQYEWLDTIPNSLQSQTQEQIRITKTAILNPNNAQLQLFNIAGQLVANTNKDINTTNLNHGIYILKINNKARKITL